MAELLSSIIADLTPLDPLPEKLRWRTRKTEFEDGGESRKRKQLYVRRNIIIKNKYDKTSGRALYDFYLARSGAYEAFSYFLPDTYTYTGEYVGRGNGSDTLFNLPSRYATSYAVYINGVEKIITTDYTFNGLAGTDQADKLTMVTAPANGDIITFDFTGYLKIRCVFAEDEMSFNTFQDRLKSTGIELRGLLNA